MATSRNDVTGDAIQTKTSSDAYRDGWERIFGNKNKQSDTDKKEEKQDEHRSDDK